MPPVEVYRRGIRVTRAELIPEPLNHIICGIIDCDHINVKPDRQTLLQDEQFRKLGEALAKSSTNLITHVARNEAALFSEILRSHRKAITRAMIKSDELRLALGQQYTVTRYLLPSSFEPDPDISLGELSRRTSSVLWLADSGRDRALADRAFHLGQVPVVVQHEVEQELLRQICDDIDIRWRHIAEAFIEDMRSRLAHAPRAENLFRRVLPEDCDLICCDDADERLPVRVVRATRRDTQLPSLRGQSGLLLRLLLRALTSDGDQKTVAVINCRNPLIAGANAGKGDFVPKELAMARILYFMGRIASGISVSVEETSKVYDDLQHCLDDYAGSGQEQTG